MRRSTRREVRGDDQDQGEDEADGSTGGVSSNEVNERFQFETLVRTDPRGLATNFDEPHEVEPASFGTNVKTT